MPPPTEPLYTITPGEEAREFSGSARVRIVRAGWFRPDAGGFFGVVPKPLWSTFAETDDRGRLLCRLNLLLIEAAGRRVLIETGTGERMNDKDRDIKGVEGGNPAVALREVGEDPASIDFVIVSHLHYDHAGGMVDRTGRPSFPNARYVVQREDAEAARGNELRVRGLMETEQLELVREAGQLTEVSADVEVVTGVSVVRTGGHTRGSQAVLIGNGRGRGVFFGDLIPTRWQLPERWTSAFDDYPVEAVETRHRLLTQAIDEEWWCYFTHDPGSLPLRLARNEKGAVRVREEEEARG
jgi:glyoxylase-like metal-dependent hydrolase (beta-lactamase superfamily II)